ncbi:pyocin activator PrtN family protein [Pseudomonas putida]|uniref:Pyocin activator protein PrtN n=1 Tax=Pseudomonas putida TaxID=303 RepID=A0A1L5PNT5_PSEPU|nr:pyocin activator PrtN family protein [Pseudomonas putida]APO81811.1 Pyocin activator protein PrtN [Pseudomonas putida]
MRTDFLLLALYGGLAVIPLERVCADFFPSLTPEKLKRKIACGAIALPLMSMERSQKSARGVHLNDLAAYIDAELAEAKEMLGGHREPCAVRAASAQCDKSFSR